MCLWMIKAEIFSHEWNFNEEDLESPDDVLSASRLRTSQTQPSSSSICRMRIRSVPAGLGWPLLLLRGGAAGDPRSRHTVNFPVCGPRTQMWHSDVRPSGRINPLTGGPHRCSAGPTLPPLSLRLQTPATAPCSTTTATCRHQWALLVLTPPPTPTHHAQGTPIGCCPVRTRGAQHQTSPLKNGYVLASVGTEQLHLL